MDASDTKPAEEWSVDELIGWIEQKRHGLLTEDDRTKFITHCISGDTFLNDGNQQFFKECGLPFGKAVTLARWSRELAKERNIQQAGDAEMSGTASLSSGGDKCFSMNDVAKLFMEFTKEKTTAGVKSKFGNREQVESAEPSSKRRRLEEFDDLISLAERASRQRNYLQEQYLDRKELCKQLSNPSLITKLPFPFPGEGKPTERFTILDGEDWCYVGREYFTTLLNEVTQLLSSATRKLSFYGTIGYGKSHLLAALVCYLTVDGKRVVYIPDCRECCEGPFGYFQAAMLFAWADDRKTQEDIIELKSMEDIHRFFRRQRKILFIFDQINALDVEDGGDDTVSNHRKEDVRKWIDAFAAEHKVIYSASANYRAQVQMDAKQTNQRKLYVYGGFSSTEMRQWWIRNNDALPDKYKANDLDEDNAGDLDKDKPDDLKTFKSEVEDLTGCIPLLLDKCIVEGKIDLSAPKLNQVFSQVQQFMFTIYDLKEHKAVWEKHCEYVTACITNEEPPAELPLQYIDHRYFYVEEDGKARYACGIAREAAARQLRQHKMTAFANQDSLDALVQYIHNPSVTGFFIEQAVLSSIVTHGLAVKMVHPHIRQEMFHSAYPRFDKSREGWVLYCPLRFNYPAIDAILVRFVNAPQKKCLMYPIQVTVAKSHADSEEKFLNHQGNWTRGLDDYDIEIEFCWITPDQELRFQHVPASSRSLRSGDILRPSYKFIHIPLGEVSQEIWTQYQRAKQSQG